MPVYPGAFGPSPIISPLSFPHHTLQPFYMQKGVHSLSVYAGYFRTAAREVGQFI